MSLMSTVHHDPLGLADVSAVTPELLRQPSGKQPRQRLALLLAVDDRLVEQPQALQRTFGAGRHAFGELDEHGLDLGVDRLGRQSPRRGDGLDRLALGDHAQELLLGRRQTAVRGHRSHEGVDDRGVERVAPGGDGADRVDQLVALGDVILQQVAVAGRALGQQRDGVLRVVVLREDHDAGAGMALAHLLGRVDALAVEGRRHPDVGDEDLGLQRGGTLDDLVVVRGHPDDLEVRVPLDQGADTLADDEVVVGQEHRDRARSSRFVGHRL